MNKIFTFLLLGLFMVSFASAIDTFQQNENMNITVTCLNNGYCSNVSFCNINVADPTGLMVVNGQNMTYQTSFFNYTLNNTELGTYCVTGYCKDGSDYKQIDYNYDVTETGNPTPTGIPIFQMGLLIIIFCVACFFMYLSDKMTEVGFKIFFLLASLIFLMATMLTGYMVSVDSNVSAALNSTTLGLIIVIGTIIVILFTYVMIRQTINALDMFKIKKGLRMDYNVGMGKSVGGYNTKRAY